MRENRNTRITHRLQEEMNRTLLISYSHGFFTIVSRKKAPGPIDAGKSQKIDFRIVEKWLCGWKRRPDKFGRKKIVSYNPEKPRKGRSIDIRQLIRKQWAVEGGNDSSLQDFLRSFTHRTGLWWEKRSLQPFLSLPFKFRGSNGHCFIIDTFFWQRTAKSRIVIEAASKRL